MAYERQGEILSTSEDPVPVGILIHCLYLKVWGIAVFEKVKTIYDKKY